MNFRLLRCVVVITFTVWFSFDSLAQGDLNVEIAKSQFQSKQVIPPSPEAAELGKYGNVPVSLFTGSPTISIPLADLKGTMLSLPLSLTYNASGFKPEELAPWTGCGWSLNAGGIITRSVSGNPDNSENYFGRTDALIVPSSSNKFAFNDYIKDNLSGAIENQPDTYFFNFAGYSGKFFVTPDNIVHKKKKDMLQITSCIQCPNNSNFRVVDEKGIVYDFAETETTRTIPMDDQGAPSNSRSYVYASTWLLTRITSADGVEQLNFEYYSTVNEQEIYVNAKQNESRTYRYQPTGGYCFNNFNIESSSYYSIPPITRSKRRFLKKITLSRNAKVISFVSLVSAPGLRLDSDFSEDRLLQQIKLYSRLNDQDKLVKQYDFAFGYFENQSNVYLKRRLRLDRVQQVAISNIASPEPPYEFTYNGNPVPDRFTASIDHWGYYNQAANTSLIPSIAIMTPNSPFPSNIGGNANREPNLEGVSTTLLTKLKYPTGGFTTFQYELNTAKFLGDNTVHQVGGTRIRDITDYAFDGKIATSKRYEYVLDDGTTSGVAGNYPKYDELSTYLFYIAPHLTAAEPCEPVFTTTRIYSLAANSILGLGSFQGSHFGYSQVIEKQMDLVSNQSLGYTTYNFDYNFSSEHDDDISNGTLSKKSVFNNAGKLLVENSYQYKRQHLGYLYSHPLRPNNTQTNKSLYCVNAAGEYFNYGSWENPNSSCIATRNIPTIYAFKDYAIQEQVSYLEKETEKIFDQKSEAFLLNTKQYTYDQGSLMLPIKIEQSTSNSELVVTEKKYSGNYTLVAGSSDTRTQGIANLLLKQILTEEIETVQYRQGIDGANKRYVSGSIKVFGPASIHPIQFLGLEIAEPLITFTLSNIVSGNFEYNGSYKPLGQIRYDGAGNLIEQGKIGDVVSSHIWDYNSSYPVAAAVNAKQDYIAYTSFESEESGNWVLTNISKTSDMSLTGNTACVMTVNSSVDRQLPSSSSTGMFLTYWSRNGALSVLCNGTPVPVAQEGLTKRGWTLFQHILPIGTNTIHITGARTIDELRLYPKDASLTTYTYEPLVGVSSQCSATNDILYYEFDGMNRLINIKDASGNLVKNFRYNYGLGAPVASSDPTLFYNAYTQVSFAKSDCASGSPTSVAYTVPYGKYAALSQADADAKASAEIASNGQAFANQVGKCVFFNTEVVGFFFKSNCSAQQGTGMRYRYVVPAGKYSAADATTAQDLANADISQNGQQAANQLGSCSCGGEGQKIINGVCETGSRNNYATVQQANGQWKCTYYYVFSDLTQSEYYSSFSSSPCATNNQ